MATKTEAGSPVPPAKPDGAAMAGATADVVRRYLSGDSLTAAEFGKVGAHYATLGTPVPKKERAEVIARTRIGTAVAAGALVRDNPPRPDPVAGLAPPPAGTPGDSKLLADTARVLLETTAGFAVRKTDRVCKKLGASADTRRELTELAKPSPVAADLICDNLPIVAAKYGVDTSCAPEIAVLSGAGLYAVQLKALFDKLNDLEEAWEKREAAKAAPAAPPDLAPAS